MYSKRQFDFESFLADHPVFTLSELADVRESARRRAWYQVRHHLGTGRLKPVAREVYAAVPPGLDPTAFEPDRYLVAAAVRPDAVFSHHAALELLGAAHSLWNECTVYTRRPRAAIAIGAIRVRFLSTPNALTRENRSLLGTLQIPHETRQLDATGPERTLVEGFRKPHRVGGIAELVESAEGFSALDFDLLEDVLEIYGQRALWAAVGWLAAGNRERWNTPNDFLARCRSERPRGFQYLVRDARGGPRIDEWNLLLPPEARLGFEGHATYP